MKSGKYSSRKWLAFVAVMALEFGAAITGIVKFVVAQEGQGGTATGFVIACFSAIAGTLAFYFAANVAHAKVVAADFHPEMQE